MARVGYATVAGRRLNLGIAPGTTQVPKYIDLPRPPDKAFPTCRARSPGEKGLTVAGTVPSEAVRNDARRFSPARIISAESCGGVLSGSFGVSGVAKIVRKFGGAR